MSCPGLFEYLNDFRMTIFLGGNQDGLLIRLISRAETCTVRKQQANYLFITMVIRKQATIKMPTKLMGAMLLTS